MLRKIFLFIMYLHDKPLSKPQLACPQAKAYPKPVDSVEQLCISQNKQENKCNRIE